MMDSVELQGFSRAERLKVHMRRHTGERPYSCHFEDCGKAFARSGDLLKHHWTHGVGEPKHSCDICGKVHFVNWSDSFVSVQNEEMCMIHAMTQQS